MGIFSIPEEVIWEMSLDRDDDEPFEPKQLKCKRCGCENVEWKETKNGWRLAYAKGFLKDKLHDCGKI